jgi:hypothetical protein
MPAPESVVAAAIAQIEQGFAVFALRADAKVPVTEHGFKNATTRPDWIRRQLEAPAAGNYGLVWPEDSAERVVVFDLDDGGGANRPWRDRMLDLIAAYGPIPPLDGIAAERLFARLASDKKTVRGAVHFVLPDRIGSVRIESGRVALVEKDGVALDPERIYRVATTDYLAKVNPAYREIFASRSPIATGLEVRDEVRKYIEGHSLK